LQEEVTAAVILKPIYIGGANMQNNQ